MRLLATRLLSDASWLFWLLRLINTLTYTYLLTYLLTYRVRHFSYPWKWSRWWLCQRRLVRRLEILSILFYVTTMEDEQELLRSNEWCNFQWPWVTCQGHDVLERPITWKEMTRSVSFTSDVMRQHNETCVHYLVQPPVCDTSCCDQPLEAAPH